MNIAKTTSVSHSNASIARVAAQSGSHRDSIPLYARPGVIILSDIKFKNNISERARPINFLIKSQYLLPLEMLPPENDPLYRNLRWSIKRGPTGFTW
jgi:hypothetical protein